MDKLYSKLRKKRGLNYRPTLFIGCTSEALPMAYKIKTLFDNKLIEVFVWKEPGVFPKTTSRGGELTTNESLLNFLDVFDFGLFIFSTDDKVINNRLDKQATDAYNSTLAPGKRRKRIRRNSSSIRHNVVYEAGMFLGRLGPQRTFFITVKSVERFMKLFYNDILEDYTEKGNVLSNKLTFRVLNEPLGNYGIKQLMHFQSARLERIVKFYQKAILNVSSKLKKEIPSTNLAMGYLDNFIIPLTQTFLRNEIKGNQISFIFQDRKISKAVKSLSFQLILPDEWEYVAADGLVKRNMRKFSNKHSLNTSKIVRCTIISSFGPRKSAEIYVNRDFFYNNGNGRLIVYDIPATLTSIYKLLKKSNRPELIKELIWLRDIRSFKSSIDAFVSSVTKQGVKQQKGVRVTYYSWRNWLSAHPEIFK